MEEYLTESELLARTLLAANAKDTVSLTDEKAVAEEVMLAMIRDIDMAMKSILGRIITMLSFAQRSGCIPLPNCIQSDSFTDRG